MTKILSHGTPQRIVRNNQAFQLVAIIEGAPTNTQFIQNLQIVGQQRRALGELRKKLAALPKSSPVSEAQAIEAQIQQIDTRLTSNMEFMTKNYGYSVQHNYLLSPIQSALLLKALDDEGKPIEDEAKATLVAEFHTPEAYEELQSLRQRALALGADESKKDEFEQVKTELNEKYGFEVGKHYLLQVRKGALYATVSA